MASKFIKSITVDVDVDIYSDDLTDDDLREICEERGIFPDFDFEDEIREMFYAFKFGNTDRAMILARKIAEEATGMILS